MRKLNTERISRVCCDVFGMSMANIMHWVISVGEGFSFKFTSYKFNIYKYGL